MQSKDRFVDRAYHIHSHLLSHGHFGCISISYLNNKMLSLVFYRVIKAAVLQKKFITRVSGL
jgi:hypothetical protein